MLLMEHIRYRRGSACFTMRSKACFVALGGTHNGIYASAAFSPRRARNNDICRSRPRCVHSSRCSVLTVPGLADASAGCTRFVPQGYM